MKFDIINRFSGEVQISVEIECAADTPPSVKLGIAVKAAIKSGANLSGANLSGSYLSGANNAGLAIAMTRILPEGQLIGWKN